jgi:hypothetical protein
MLSAKRPFWLKQANGAALTAPVAVEAPQSRCNTRWRSPAVEEQQRARARELAVDRTGVAAVAADTKS